MTLTLATRLGPYEILGPLGAGGMGEVYRATDTRLGRTVALKVLPEEFLEGEERRARFEREARTLASLNHPNIATLYSFEEIEGRSVLTMELLEGESLREVLLRRSPTQRQVLGWAVQAARGLSAAHQKGIVHRDIKPENLFLTTDGFLKVLDFGIAKQSSPATSTEGATASQATGAGVVLGTLAYLSPEQAEGLPVDARSDVFSLGVVLYELLARKHPFRRETAGATVAAILRDSPPPLSSLDSAVAPAVDGIVGRCLAKERGERFQGALELALVLEAVLAAPAGSVTLTEVEEKSPYPGIASFTEKDSGLFFGRESEVKGAWDRIRAHRLLAVIGPSGAGKTSFLRAGVLPARPDGWAAIVATPGVSPFRGLGQALAPELLTDADAVRQLVNVDDPDTAYHLALRWRRRHAEAVLVLDQFEELFTLNAVEVQAAFAALLARLAEDAGVHVVLSLRDDFFMRCHDHRPLLPVFDALMPLGSLTPEALARALVEPAKKRGYRFEDEALVGEMVAAVSGERGALPLLAFAVARLWELRDREARVLTREAYAEIGGVAGALARHAEATMDRIGAGREPVVRDLFRNLVTAQGTRSVADRDELLSAFPDRKGAEEVLCTLLDARLLTSYELEKERGASGRCRIEIVHESLLKAWPRLVRWQAQDEEGALLRDQLRQAARLWVDKGRTGDLLWTGTAFQEFELWRGRYRGALTEVEEDFGKAMRDRMQRRRRLRRAAVVAALVVLSGVAIAIGISRQQAVAAARRAEAAKLLAIAQERLAADPTEALAYTTASLEVADSPEARLFALRALFEAPPALDMPGADGNFYMMKFSPDGRQLATGGYATNAQVFREEGGAPSVLSGHSGVPFWVGDRLVLLEAQRPASVWSLPELRLEKTLDIAGAGTAAVFDSRLFFASLPGGKDGARSEMLLRSWSPAERDPIDLGRVPFTEIRRWGPGGASWLYASGARLLSRAVPVVAGSPETVLGEHAPAITSIVAWEKGLITVNASKQMKRWTFESGQVRAEDFPTPPGADPPVGLNRGWIFEMAPPAMRLWRQRAWPGARPFLLRREASWYGAQAQWHPSGEWLAASTFTYTRLTFWPLRSERPVVVDLGPWRGERPMAFSPDGRWLATWYSGSAVRLWPVPPGSAEPRTLDIPALRNDVRAFAFDPGGRFLFCLGPSIWIVPLDGRPPKKLEGFTRTPFMHAAAVSPSGRFVAAGYMSGPGDRALRVWDLEKGTTRAYDLSQAQAPPPQGSPGSGPGREEVPVLGIESLTFADDSTLYSSGDGGVRRWNLATGQQEVVVATGERGAVQSFLRPDQSLVLMALYDNKSSAPCMTLVTQVIAEKSFRELSAFGKCVQAFDLDRTGRIVAAAGSDGIIRVGRLSGGEPHLLVGHKGLAANVVLSPDLKWVASVAEDATLRLWPMPDMEKPPLHTLTLDAFVAKLKSLTNLRAVRDAKAATGWKIEVGPFPGWKNVPEW